MLELLTVLTVLAFFDVDVVAVEEEATAILGIEGLDEWIASLSSLIFLWVDELSTSSEIAASSLSDNSQSSPSSCRSTDVEVLLFLLFSP